MLRLLWIGVCILFMCTAAYSQLARQEQAKINCNPKYMKACQAFTGRQRRGEPYKTNVTVTMLNPWGNNVTLDISFYKVMSPPIVITTRICDMIKHKWLMDFTMEHLNVPMVCPLAAGHYELLNIELPPKNFPLPVIKGAYRLNTTYYITDTKEIILYCTLKLSVM